MGDLSKSLANLIASAVGMHLQGVVIRALDGEIAHREELTDPHLYIGGEVRLDFESQSVFISWATGDGWPDHFSIGVRSESSFNSSMLKDWDVSNLEPWSRCIGRRMIAARIFAIRGTPHVVEFLFDGQTIWIADGWEHAIGDGDDLLLREGAFPGCDGSTLMWSSRPTAVGDRPVRQAARSKTFDE